jgi:hypothetical protein
MITEKDIKTLTQYQTPSGKIAYWLLMIAPIFVLVAAIINLHNASRIASYEGYNLMHLFKGWINGIDVKATYSGLYLKAMERLTTALMEIGYSLILSIFAYGYHKRKKMDERIIETLKNSEKMGIITKRFTGSA